MRHERMILAGGWSLVIFSLLFTGIGIALSLMPAQGLYSLTSHGLMKVMGGSAMVHALLSIYAVTPLLLIPGAIGTYYTFVDVYDSHMRLATSFALVGAIALTLSLMMLPSLNWIISTYLLALPT